MHNTLNNSEQRIGKMERLRCRSQHRERNTKLYILTDTKRKIKTGIQGPKERLNWYTGTDRTKDKLRQEQTILFLTNLNRKQEKVRDKRKLKYESKYQVIHTDRRMCTKRQT